MPRKRKPSGKSWRGPYTFTHLERSINLDGWQLIKGQQAGTKHENYAHPTKGGKVSLDKHWDSIRANDDMFRSVANQAGLSPKALLKLMQQISR